DRAGEEEVVDAVILNALAEAFGVGERVSLPLLPGEELHGEQSPSGGLGRLFRGEVDAGGVEADGRQARGGPPPAAMLPGAFNPVHEGHWDLAAAAARLLGVPVAFELSVTNVDKPPLSPAEVRRRLAQFAWHGPVWVTRTPTFAEKARLFPGAAFVV